MKKYLLTAVIFTLVIFTSTAQKFGFVDTETILNEMPEYAQAQEDIDKVSVDYQKEIEGMYEELDSLFQTYRDMEVMMTEEMKRKKQDEIAEKEKSIKEYQKKIFGYEGLIFKKRQELIEPIQDKISKAVEKVAKTHNLQVVFDKASDLTILYAVDTHDYSDYVREELGLKEKEGVSEE